MHVHVGPVEQRIALGEHHDGAAGLEVHGESGCGLLVELRHGAGVATGVLGGPGGHGIAELLLDDTGRDEVGGDPASVRLLADPGVERDDVGLGDQPGGLAGDELGVAGTEPDAIEPSCAAAPGHSRS